MKKTLLTIVSQLSLSIPGVATAGPLQAVCEGAMQIYADMAGVMVVSHCIGADSSAALEKAKSIYRAAAGRTGKMQMGVALDSINEILAKPSDVKAMCDELTGTQPILPGGGADGDLLSFQEKDLSNTIYASVKEGCVGK